MTPAQLSAEWVAEALRADRLLAEYRPATGPAPIFSGATIDSRRTAPGDLFFALPGAHTDGHAFLEAAVAAGATGLVVRADLTPGPFPRREGVPFSDTLSASRSSGLPIASDQGTPFPPREGGRGVRSAAVFRVADVAAALRALAAAWRGRWRGRAVGVTGSVGKTTTKELVAAVLARGGGVLKSEGNFNNELGLPLTLLGLRADHAWAALEMGMEARGDLAALAALARPAIGVVTNVGTAHLEKLGTVANIAWAKAELIEALPPVGLAVLNADDARVLAMRRQAACPVLSYGASGTADIRLIDYRSRGAAGSEFRFAWRGEVIAVSLGLLGRHAVQDALAAAAVGLGVGLTPEAVVAGLGAAGASLRMVLRPGRRGSLVVDDCYNAGPASVVAALASLPELGGARRIAVLGDMLELGSYEEAGHREVGRAAAECADRVVAVGRLGRIIGEAATLAGAAVAFAPDNAAAVALLDDLDEGDVVLVKGSRGAHMEEIVRAITLDG
jgi:UDP-N-acetylmuramoyl-tripeptide--D-alanyl-D-alanine ligase